MRCQETLNLKWPRIFWKREVTRDKIIAKNLKKKTQKIEITIVLGVFIESILLKSFKVEMFKYLAYNLLFCLIWKMWSSACSCVHCINIMQARLANVLLETQ